MREDIGREFLRTELSIRRSRVRVPEDFYREVAQTVPQQHIFEALIEVKLASQGARSKEQGGAACFLIEGDREGSD